MQVIGDALRSRTDERRATEVEVAAHALNRMLALGCPSYIRLARPQTGVEVSASACLIRAPQPVLDPFKAAPAIAEV